MGSGAFLVEACRAIAAKLVEAWAQHQNKSRSFRLTRMRSCMPAASSRSAVFMVWTRTRLATDLAKLSLWLATLARGAPI